MTENRRIFWNVVATYTRSLLRLACGIFTGRWVLQALGDIDFGLLGLVGGMTAFIYFFNDVFASAIGRFYALAVGAQRSAVDKKQAVEECRAWFNTAVSIHTVVPCILMLLGYPIGIWTVRNYLTIPEDRVESCVWLFRFVCISCFLGMSSIPYNAMYKAKQRIAELTIYTYVTIALNVCFLYYMVTHPGFWLVKYSLWSCALAVLPQLIITARALIVFPECKFNVHMMFRVSRIRQLGGFACWQFIGIASAMLRSQGISIVANKVFGPHINAAMAIGGSVDGHVNALAGSMTGAFSPAIMNAYGAGDMKRTEMLVFRTCKYGVLLSMLFVVPVMAEINELLRLWLKNPPAYAAGFAALYLFLHLLENSTHGHRIAVNASGKIAFYQVAMGSISLLAVPIAAIWGMAGGSPYVMTYAIIITVLVYTFLRLYLAKRIVKLPIGYWIFKIALPLGALFLLLCGVALIPRCWMEPGFMRIVVVTALVEGSLIPLAWTFVLSPDERQFLLDKIMARFRKGFVGKCDWRS